MKTSTFKFKPFSRKQRQLLDWWCDTSPVKDRDGIIADGAIRSGKTVAMSLSFVMWAMSRFNGENFIISGKTVGSCRRNVVKPLKQMLSGRGYSVQDRRSDNVLVIVRGNVSNEFYIFGGKDEGSQDLVQGITAAGAFFDEVALMPESFVNQATGRCSVDGSKFWFNCNPGSPYHWFKQSWIDGRRDKNMLYLHFTMDDNLALTERIKERYRGMYRGVFFKRYILGLWVMAEGLIYDMFDTARHVVSPAMIPRILPHTLHVSCDYGTQNATVFHLWGQGADKKWYCIREYYYSGREKAVQKTDVEYAEDLNKWLDGIRPVKIVVDPSAASFIAELKRRGYSIKKARNDVLDGIRYLASLLMNNEVAFCSECVMTIREFASYVWDEKAAERGEDKPLKKFDHAMDSARYFAYTIIRKPSGMSVMK